LIPITRPLLGDEEIAAATRVLRSGWIMQGPEVEAFEAELGAYLDVPHVVAVSSGTAALHLALLALGIGPGDEVITVSHSYIATANSIVFAGAHPVFVDIRPETLNLDPALVEAACTPATRAIVCVHQLGMPCDLSAILAIAQRRQLRVIEDAACAIGSEVLSDGNWQRIGRPHGDVACFSFHPRKLVTTGDGGAVTSRDPAVAERVRLLRQHGLSRPDAPALLPGLNYRLTDLQAAVGRVQLGRLPSLLDERKAQVARYRELLSSLPVVLPFEPRNVRSNWQSFCVRMPGVDTAALVAKLAQRGISVRGGVMNAHEEPAYAAGLRLPHSELARREALMLPLFPGLTATEQSQVCEEIGTPG